MLKQGFSNLPILMLNYGPSSTLYSAILDKSELFLTLVLLSGNEYFEGELNSLIWNATLDPILFAKKIVEQFISSSLILFLIIAVYFPGYP